MAHVLIIDDEPQLGRLLEKIVCERGHSCDLAASGEEGLVRLGLKRPDAVLLDRQMNGMGGFEALRQMFRIAPEIPVIMMTAYGNVESAVQAMRLGAVDFVEKPFDNDKLLATMETALLAKRRPSITFTVLEGQSLVGESPRFRAVLALAERFAVPDISVLLTGETGTGKEMFAKSIHAASKRKDQPFVAVDCSACPETLIDSELFGHEKGAFTSATTSRIGRLEQAQGGTLFLDEIGNLPISLQPKLLRVLQTRSLTRVGGREAIRLNLRIIAATNANLKELMTAGVFRPDLYYRLAEMTIDLPPLREREGDVRRIAEHYLTFYACRFGHPVRGLSDAAVDLLVAYGWPGNVRELESVIKRAVVLAGDVILPEHLPPEVRAGRDTITCPAAAPLATDTTDDRLEAETEIELGLSARGLDLKTVGQLATETAERAYLAALLAKTRLSAARLASLLGVDRKTLRTKLKKYGLESAVGHE